MKRTAVATWFTGATCPPPQSHHEFTNSIPLMEIAITPKGVIMKYIVTLGNVGMEVLWRCLRALL